MPPRRPGDRLHRLNARREDRRRQFQDITGVTRRRPVDGPTDADRAKQATAQTNRHTISAPALSTSGPIEMPAEPRTQLRGQARPDTHHGRRGARIRRAQFHATGQQLRRQRPSRWRRPRGRSRVPARSSPSMSRRFRSTARRDRTGDRARCPSTPSDRVTKQRRRCRLHATQVPARARLHPLAPPVDRRRTATDASGPVAMAFAHAVPPDADVASAPRPM